MWFTVVPCSEKQTEERDREMQLQIKVAHFEGKKRKQMVREREECKNIIYTTRVYQPVTAIRLRCTIALVALRSTPSIAARNTTHGLDRERARMEESRKETIILLPAALKEPAHTAINQRAYPEG